MVSMSPGNVAGLTEVAAWTDYSRPPGPPSLSCTAVLAFPGPRAASAVPYPSASVRVGLAISQASLGADDVLDGRELSQAASFSSGLSPQGGSAPQSPREMPNGTSPSSQTAWLEQRCEQQEESLARSKSKITMLTQLLHSAKHSIETLGEEADSECFALQTELQLRDERLLNLEAALEKEMRRSEDAENVHQSSEMFFRGVEDKSRGVLQDCRQLQGTVMDMEAERVMLEEREGTANARAAELERALEDSQASAAGQAFMVDRLRLELHSERGHSADVQVCTTRSASLPFSAMAVRVCVEQGVNPLAPATTMRTCGRCRQSRRTSSSTMGTTVKSCLVECRAVRCN